MSDSLAVRPTRVPGVLYIEVPLHADDRGWFKESFQKAKLEAEGFPDFAIVQSNVAYNAERGVTRGIHAEPWDKYISLAQGRAFAAVVDLRESPGFGQSETFELHAGNAIFVPRGCGNSYQTLTNDVVYTYLVNAHWSPDASYMLVDAYDPELAIAWPVPLEGALRSDKDRGLPPLSDVTPMAV